MNYIEINRTVEPHGECILFVYLQDANGVPAPNVKMKLWAGPPPSGNPPYFVDDDPNNPNRRTDANGKFQFIVAVPSPANPLDFYVQALGPSGAPQSQPIHFPFPARVAQWVTVTLAPEGATPGGAPAPTPELQLDPRLASEVGVSVQFATPAPGQTYWKLISAQYQNPDESGGNVNIVCYVQNDNGLPLPGARVLQRFPGDQATGLTDERGHVDFPMSGDSSFAPSRNKHGPYSALVDGMPSDLVVGMGLPLKRHVQYILTWRRAVAGATPTPTPTPLPTPTPTPAPLPTPTPTPAPLPTPTPTAKALTHYLLFGPGTQPSTMTNLILALDYIVRYAPVAGFSVDEALNAQHVTIVGDASAVSAAAEQRLRAAGCQVARLTAADSYALERVFQQLLASGSPYPA